MHPRREKRTTCNACGLHGFDAPVFKIVCKNRCEVKHCATRTGVGVHGKVGRTNNARRCVGVICVGAHHTNCAQFRVIEIVVACADHIPRAVERNCAAECAENGLGERPRSIDQLINLRLRAQNRNHRAIVVQTNRFADL